MFLNEGRVIEDACVGATDIMLMIWDGTEDIYKNVTQLLGNYVYILNISESVLISVFNIYPQEREDDWM